jgi:hypothetical protein
MRSWRCGPWPSLLPACILLVVALAAVPARAARLTPPELLREMASQFSTIRDYQVLVYAETPDRKPRRHEFLLEFLRRADARQSNMLRLNIRSGKNDGADLVVRQDGSIRMRGGGLFSKHFPVTLRRDDPRVQLGDGLALWQSDFGSLIDRLAVACEGAASAGIEPLSPTDLKRMERADPRHPAWEDRAGAYRLRVERPDEQGLPVQLEVVVSRQTSMPLEYAVTRGGKLVIRVTFGRFRPNVGKKPGRFRF